MKVFRELTPGDLLNEILKKHGLETMTTLTAESVASEFYAAVRQDIDSSRLPAFRDWVAWPRTTKL